MNKPILLVIGWLVLGVSLWADPSASPKGVMILTSASGLDPRNVLFGDQVWTDFYGGNVIDTDGQKSVFAKKDIGKIIYFDPHYYVQLDNDQQEKAFRAGIQVREVVVNTSFLNLDAATGVKALQDNQSTLESLVHEYPSIQSLIQPQIDLLRDDMSKLSSGQSLVNGQWMSQQEAAAQSAVPVVGEVNKPVTFTTKYGKKYENATVSVTDTGLSVLTSDGGGSVAFDQLPDDLSIFTDSVRKQIAEKRKTPPITNAIPPTDSMQSSPTTSTLNTDAPVPSPSSKEDGVASSHSDLEAQEEAILSAINKVCSDPEPFEFVQHPAPGGGTFGDYQDKYADFRKQLTNQIDSLARSCDPELPDDVKVALDFVRSKYQDKSNPDSNQRLVILPHSGVFIYLVPFPSVIQIVSLKDLNPDDIVERSSQSANANLDLYTTGRKPLVKELGGAVPHATCLTLTPQSDNTNQRVVNALTDIIKYYGGKPEPSIEDAKTSPQLIAFIQERLDKANLERKLTFSFDEKSGEITLIYGPLPGWKPPGAQEAMRAGDALCGTITQSINIKDMRPEDFTWEKSGEEPSKLNLGITDEVDFRGNKIQYIDGSHDLINCATEQDAQDVATAFQNLCEMNGWKPSKY